MLPCVAVEAILEAVCLGRCLPCILPGQEILPGDRGTYLLQADHQSKAHPGRQVSRRQAVRNEADDESPCPLAAGPHLCGLPGKQADCSPQNRSEPEFDPRHGHLQKGVRQKFASPAGAYARAASCQGCTGSPPPQPRRAAVNTGRAALHQPCHHALHPEPCLDHGHCACKLLVRSSWGCAWAILTRLRRP